MLPYASCELYDATEVPVCQSLCRCAPGRHTKSRDGRTLAVGYPGAQDGPPAPGPQLAFTHTRCYRYLARACCRTCAPGGIWVGNHHEQAAREAQLEQLPMCGHQLVNGAQHTVPQCGGQVAEEPRVAGAWARGLTWVNVGRCGVVKAWPGGVARVPWQGMLGWGGRLCV